MVLIDRVLNVFIRQEDDGRFIFCTSRLWGRKYRIPDAQQAAVLRRKLKPFVIVYYIWLLLILVSLGFVDDQDALMEALILPTIVIYGFRYFYFKKLTKNLELIS